MRDDESTPPQPTNWRRLDRIDSQLRSHDDELRSVASRVGELEARMNAGMVKVFESIESLRAEVIAARHHATVRTVGKGGALVAAIVAAIEVWAQLRGLR